MTFEGCESVVHVSARQAGNCKYSPQYLLYVELTVIWIWIRSGAHQRPDQLLSLIMRQVGSSRQPAVSGSLNLLDKVLLRSLGPFIAFTFTEHFKTSNGKAVESEKKNLFLLSKIRAPLHCWKWNLAHCSLFSSAGSLLELMVQFTTYLASLKMYILNILCVQLWRVMGKQPFIPPISLFWEVQA